MRAAAAAVTCRVAYAVLLAVLVLVLPSTLDALVTSGPLAAYRTCGAAVFILIHALV